MNVVLEYAAIELGQAQEGRYPIVIANGPVACELDLFAPVGSSENGRRRLFTGLLRELAPILTAEEPSLSFVPSIAEEGEPWRIGIRLGQVTKVEASAPSAALTAKPGEPVLEGDPAYRIVLVGESDTATFRTDRAGVEALLARCHSAAEAYRDDSEPVL